MFYQKGININNTKSMFNFLNNHFMYDTMNSWNNLKSIANNVKIHKLKLEGNEWEALAALQRDNYFEVNSMIEDWEHEHKGYEVNFNGRSGGYLVLYNDNDMCCAIPDRLIGYDSYEDFKEDYKYYGTMKDAKYELREYTKLVQDFDKLCDEIRDYVNELSKRDLKLDCLNQTAIMFNTKYYNDLKETNTPKVEVIDDQIDISNIKLSSLREAFMRVANRYCDGYEVKLENNILSLDK